MHVLIVALVLECTVILQLLLRLFQVDVKCVSTLFLSVYAAYYLAVIMASHSHCVYQFV